MRHATTESIDSRITDWGVRRFVESAPMLPRNGSGQQDETKRIDDVADDVYQQFESINRQFEVALTSQVKLLQTSRPFESVEEVARCYDSDWRALKRCRQDWIHLLKSLVRIKTDAKLFRGTGFKDAGLESAVRIWREELLDGVSWPREIRMATGIPLGELAPDDAAAALKTEIAQTIRLMATAMIHHLTTLTDRAVCGGIWWQEYNHCVFTYCTHEIESKPDYDNWRSFRVAGTVLREEIDEPNRDATRTVAGYQHTDVAGVRQRKLTIHVHEITDAIVSHPLNTLVEVPADQHAILELVPTWLDDIVRIVEGNLVGVQLWQRDLESESWIKHIANRATWVERGMFLGRRPHFDPAIVLSNQFVLSGWLISELESVGRPSTFSEFVQKWL